MRIIPVLDLKDGLVVRGIAGRRQEYRPIVGRLTDSCRPADVALAFRARFELKELYLADLDAIAGAAPALPIYQELQALGCRLWVDAGIRTVKEAAALAAARIEKIVVGLETVASPAALASICRELGGERVIFSLDLRAGQPMGNLSAWDQPDAWTIADQAVSAGVRGLIVLDLARVGVDSGTGTEELCRRLASSFPDVEILAGGGVRDVTDLRRLKQCGVRAVLVASALHDGRLRPDELAEL